MIDKRRSDAHEAVADIPDGAIVHVGGFAEPNGTPFHLIKALADRKVRDLVLVSIEAGCSTEYFDRLRHPPEDAPAYAHVPIAAPFYPPSYLIEQGCVARVITAWATEMHHGRMSPLEAAVAAGTIEVELTTQGTLAERIRAAQAGISAFYCPVGIGTFTTEGKEIRDFDGVPHALETALRADFALIRAYRADRYGNLIYRGVARTINPVMAGAAHVTIAQVDHAVEAGELDPESIVTPGVFVDRVVCTGGPA
jgi:3-oxoadipate CoA-transferase alpha subunit